MARASASLFVSDVAAALAYFAFALLVARLAGPSARGAVAFVTAIPLLLGYGSTLGLDAANLFHGGAEPEERPALVTTSVIVGLLSGTAFAAATWGVFAWRPEWVPGSVSDGLLAAGLAITGLMTVQIALDAALIGSGHAAPANAVRIVMPVTALVLYAGAAVVTGRTGATIAVTAWVVSRVAGFFLSIGLSARRIGVAGIRRFRRTGPRLLRYGLPAHVGALADLPIRRFDTLMLGASRGSTELGVYTAAVNGAEVMFYLPTSVSSALLPAAASLDGPAARSLTRKVLMIVVAATALAAAFVIAFAPLLVRFLFGSEFDGSVLPLRILALALVGTSIRIVLRSALLSQRRQGLSSAMTVLTLVTIVGLDLLLIPRYGATGAAIASAGAYWLGAIFMYAAFLRVMPRGEGAPGFGQEAREAWAMVTSLVRRHEVTSALSGEAPAPEVAPLPLATLPAEPLVSVLVSNYNYGTYLGGAIESVLSQTYGRFEVVVCDDGSTDGSRAVIARYAEGDERVVAVLKENGGQASALNAAFRASRGDVVCFLDADDELDPRRLELLVDALRRERAGGAVHPLAVHDEGWAELYTLPVGYRPEGGWLGSRAAARGGRWSVAAGGAIAFRREVAEVVFPIPEDVFTGADADAFLFTLLPLLTEVAYVGEPLYRYRLHDANEGLLRSLDAPSVERRLAFIETTTAAVNDRLARLDPPRAPLRLEDNLGYEEQRFFLDVFAPDADRKSLRGRFGALVRKIVSDDVYTASRKMGLLLLYATVMFVPGGVRPRAISGVRWLSYRSRALMSPRWIVGAVLVPLGAAVAAWGIGRESFFLDEVASVAFARLDTPRLLDVLLEREANSSLYFLLLHPWAAVAETEGAVRALSALFAVAAIPFTYLLGTKLFGRAAGVVAALLMVVNALWVRFAQQARGYSLVLLGVTAGTWLLLVAHERKSRGLWAAYAVTMSLAVYAHFFALFVVIAHALTLLFRERRLAPLVPVYGAIAVLVSPLLVFALTRDSGQLSWIPRPSVVDVPVVLSLLAGGRTTAGGAVLLVLYGGLALVAMRGAWRERESPDAWKVVLLAALVAVPVLGSFAVSLVKPIFQFNYLIVALPGLLLLGVAGLARLRGRLVYVVTLALLLVVGAREVAVQHRETNNEEWRAVAAYVSGRAEPGDRVAFLAPYVRLPFGYYAARHENAPAPAERAFSWYPADTERDLVTGALAIYPRPEDEGVADLERLAYERLWVVLSSEEPEQADALRAPLAGYEVVLEESFVDVDVILLERT